MVSGKYRWLLIIIYFIRHEIQYVSISICLSLSVSLSALKQPTKAAKAQGAKCNPLVPNEQVRGLIFSLAPLPSENGFYVQSAYSQLLPRKEKNKLFDVMS